MNLDAIPEVGKRVSVKSVSKSLTPTPTHPAPAPISLVPVLWK